MFKSVWKLTSALTLVALTTAPAEARPPQGPPVEPPMALTVDCSADSIQAAVDQAAAGTPLTITVIGTCIEEVGIIANDVTIQGKSIADELVGGFTITGAQRVTIKSLTIRDGTIGVFASRGASVVLDDIFVSGQSGYGIFMSRNAYADIFGSTAENPAGGNYALILADGAVVRARDSTFTSANGAANDSAAVGIFRSSSARFDGTIFIDNSAVGGGIPGGTAFGGGFAVQVFHTSNLRVASGVDPDILLVNGDVIIGNNSAASLRNVNVGGDIAVNGDSNLTVVGECRLNPESGPPDFGPCEVSGTVTIDDQSLLSASGPVDSVSIPLGVTCTGAGGAGGVINSAAIDGTVTGCSTF